jgi:hypothetical protein
VILPPLVFPGETFNFLPFSPLACAINLWKTDRSKPVKQEVNGTVILSPLVFPGQGLEFCWPYHPIETLLSKHEEMKKYLNTPLFTILPIVVLIRLAIYLF